MALPNRPEPAAQFERRNPADDEFYELAGTWLRDNTRNTKTFSILFNELVAYGFPPQSARREVSALALNVLVVLICAGILWYRWPFDMSDSMIARITRSSPPRREDPHDRGFRVLGVGRRCSGEERLLCDAKRPLSGRARGRLSREQDDVL